MAELRHERTGAVTPLAARTLVGRSPVCALRIDNRHVSAEHAVLVWKEGLWLVRDLGSRNGTFIAGVRLSPGEERPLAEAATVAFGEPGALWTLVDAGPPQLMARRVDGTAVRVASGGMLGLPSEEDPRALLFEDAEGHWRAELPDQELAVTEGQVLVLDGEGWVLSLPQGLDRTWGSGSAPMTLGAVELRFTVSPDEEHIALELVHGGQSVALPVRAHNELLLLLAREWSREEGIPAAERGWRYVDEVRRGLGVDEQTLNVHIFRARRQLDQSGVLGAAGIIERRPRTGQLRIGVHRLRFGAPG